MSQWSACGSRTVCSQWLVVEEVRVDGSLSILIVNWWTTWQGRWLIMIICILDTFICGPRGHWGFNWRFGSSLEERGRWKELSGVPYWLLELPDYMGNRDQVNIHTGVLGSEHVHLDAKLQALHVTSHWFTKGTNTTRKILHPLRVTIILYLCVVSYLS